MKKRHVLLISLACLCSAATSTAAPLASTDPHSQECISSGGEVAYSSTSSPQCALVSKSDNLVETRPLDRPQDPPRFVAKEALSLKPPDPKPPASTASCATFDIALPALTQNPSPLHTASPPEPIVPPAPAAPPSRAPASTETVPAPALVPVVPPATPLLPPSAPPAIDGGAVSQVNNNLYSTLATAAGIADNQPGSELADATLAAQQALAKDAASDQRSLADAYRDLPPDQTAVALQRAQVAINETLAALTNSKVELNPAEKARIINTLLNARDKAAPTSDALGTGSPTLLGALNALTPSRQAASAESLVNRTILFSGLAPEQQGAVLGKLKLADRTHVTLANGQQRTLVIFHNGSLSQSSLALHTATTAALPECAYLTHTLLFPELRKGAFTTNDLRAIWIYRHTGIFPDQPKYLPAREKFIRRSSEGFIAIDPYAHETPHTGDLLIQRTLNDPLGHVFMVRDYTASTLTAKVIETTPSGASLREREFEMSADPLDARERFIKPGLMILRLRPSSNGACVYKEQTGSTAPTDQPSAPSSATAGPSEQGVAR